MNPVSFAIYTMEEHCATVFAGVVGIFFMIMFMDRRRLTQRLEESENRAKTVKMASSSNGNGTGWSRRDDDDPDELQPALPANTPQVAYCPPRRPDPEMLSRSAEFYQLMSQRRTVRMFSKEPVPAEVLENVIKTAGTSPSGAHTEPWSFVVVQDPDVKAAIRDIVETEEEINYQRRMSRQWTTDLKPFKTTPVKPYLTEAPALLLVFRQSHSWREGGKKKMHYYSELSVAIAAGILIAAIQYCGLVTLTSTPLGAGAKLGALLSRPSNERLELLLPVGRPHPGATVPDLARKPYCDIAVHV